jgi:hypothetical protein
VEGARDVRVLRLCAFLSGALFAVAHPAGGQALSPPTYAEYRLDAIFARSTSVQGGLGAVIPLGTYVRLSIDGAGGATWQDGVSRATGRVDAVGRFLLDPLREVPFGLSVGGGLSLLYDADGDKRVRPYVTAVVDLEARKRRGITPAFQLGLGGGTRVGVVLRSSSTRWR